MGICIKEEGQTCVSCEDLYFARNTSTGKSIAFSPIELLHEDVEAGRDMLVIKLEKERIRSTLVPQSYFNKKLSKQEGMSYYKIANLQSLSGNALVSFQEIRKTLLSLEKLDNKSPMKIMALDHISSRLVDLNVIPKTQFSYYSDDYSEELAK